ncbi:MAG: hypothetical protein MMC33_000734 [Icmadophila ericetorum]|nr:hypothetical protein [Icmadophila ericetorum]
MVRSTTRTLLSLHPITRSSFSRSYAAQAASITAAKKEGDISSVFVSLSGTKQKPLPQRFITQKYRLIAGKEEALMTSWNRLLQKLEEEARVIKSLGSIIVPEINYEDIDRPSTQFTEDHKRRGVALVRGCVSEKQALDWKENIRAYLRANPSTKAFPADKPAVYELYWTPSQVEARAHPNLLRTHKFLLSQWHSKDKNALISVNHPVSYADRLRIRMPGDSGFSLGPHVDGGSCERWEASGYGLGHVYDTIFAGEWENYDAFESSCRLPVVSDLYSGAGACSMFRMYQGWMAMSHTSPGEGTLLVNPLFKLATAYYMLRPFFSPKRHSPGSAAYLDARNWQLEPEPTVELQGASMGHTQELNDALHPHLRLKDTMVHVPTVRPGDYIAWHCDTIHAVDGVHTGKTDSSVMYIPACPLTEANARYLARQRQAFIEGVPGNDFPGGKGESQHIGRGSLEHVARIGSDEGQQAMGLKKWDTEGSSTTAGEREVLRKANEVLGFS